MRYITWLTRRLRVLFRRSDVESDLSDELHLHLDMEAAELIRQGHSPEEARREARLLLGGVEQTKEAARDVRPLHWLSGLGLDLRLGLRMLRKSWGLTLVGGLAMAVAISIGTTAFAVLDAYAGNTLPLEQGDRVIRLVAFTRSGGATSFQDFEWWRERMRSLADISAFSTIERFLVTTDGSEGRVSVAQMTPQGFRLAGVQALAGRTLTEEDERADATPVVVIGYDVWQSRFAGSRAALGQTVQLGGVDRVIVGIMPEDFAFPVNHQAWIPFRTSSLGDPTPGNSSVVIFARLARGVPVEKAEAELAVIGPAPRTLPSGETTRADIEPYARAFTPVPAWWAMIPLLLAFVLVPPCANIAILIYARNVSRQGEFSARYVLGAGRGRIVGQLLIEAFMLAGAAAGAGLLLAHQFLGAFQSFIDQQPGFPFWIRPGISLKTVLYVAGLAAFAAIVAGGLPALRATGRARQAALQGLGARTSPRLGLKWTALVVMQVALSSAVLPRMGEIIWMFLQPNATGRDFPAEEYVTARIALESNRSANPAPGTPFRDLQAELVRRVQHEIGTPGVTVSASIDGIDEAIGWVETDIAGQKPLSTGSNRVDAAYFDVFQSPLLAGRTFEAADFHPDSSVVIVDRAFAEKMVGQNPLGKHVRPLYKGTERWHEIVGLVDTISPSAQRPFIYYPKSEDDDPSARLTIRTGRGVPPDFTRRLLGITTALDLNLQVEDLRTLADLYRAERREEDGFGLALSTILLVILLFSAAGIHTLVAFAVAQRRREIGIRSALGAAPARLVTDVFRRDLFPVVAGAVVGTLLAVPVDKLIPRDDGLSLPAVSIFAAFVFILLIGLLAIAGPARRALSIDPTEALREG